MRDTIRVVQSGNRRIKVFADFWNVVINARSKTSFDIGIDWSKLSEQIVWETKGGHSDESLGELAGCYVFGSYSKSNPQEAAFKDEVLDDYGSSAGIFFDFKERVRKTTAAKCGKCGEPVSRSSELGVDVLLTVEMIKHAAMREHEYLALISSDRDYLPLLSYLKDLGQRVIHVATGTPDREMRSHTWKQVGLGERYPYFTRLNKSENLILTVPHQSEMLSDAEKLLTANGVLAKIVDVTDKSQINDRDLQFILSNMRIHLSYADEVVRANHSQLPAELHLIREALASGELRGPFPYVIRQGRVETYFDDNWIWMTMGDRDGQREGPRRDPLVFFLVLKGPRGRWDPRRARRTPPGNPRR